MTVTLDALRQRIAAAAGGTFTLAPADVGIDDVSTLFKTYLPNSTLTLGDCKPASDRLSLTGSMTLGSVVSTAASFTILPDAGNVNVAGVVITLPLDTWKIDLPFASVDASSLASRGASNACLELRAGGTDPDEADPAARILGDLALTLDGTTHFASIAATVPPPSELPWNYAFEAVLTNVSISSFGDLAALVPAFSFSPPSAIPTASTLELTGLEFIISPETGLVSLNIATRSDKGATLIPNIVAIDYFEFQFNIYFPDDDTDLRMVAMAGAAVRIHDTEVDVLAYLPDLTFLGHLSHDTPVPLGPFLEQFGVSDAMLDGLQLTDFDCSVGLVSPYPYALSIGIDGSTSISLNGVAIAIERITLVIAAEGTGPVDVSFGGTIDIGGVAIYVDVAKSGSEWKVTGGTAGESGLDFAAWIDSVAKTYGYSGLPASVTGLSLDKVRIAYDTGDASQSFTFGCHGDLAISNVTVDTTLNITLSRAGGHASSAFDGTLVIETPSEDLEFDLDVTVDAAGTTFIGTLSTGTKPAGLLDLCRALGFHPYLPDGLDIQLDDLAVGYRTRSDGTSGNAATLVLSATTSIGRAMLIADRTASGTTYLFGADAAISGSLSDIPVVGNRIPPELGLALDGVQLLIASRQMSAAEMVAIEDLLETISAKLPSGAVLEVPALAMSDSACLVVTYTLGGGNPSAIVIGPGPSTQDPTPPPPPPFPFDPSAPGSLRAARGKRAASSVADATPPVQSVPGKDGTVWIDVQRTLGVLTFNRIGFAFANGDLAFSIDAAARLGPVSLELDGLTIGSPLTSFSPMFDLRGIGLSYLQPPIDVSGALIKVPGGELSPTVKYQYDGQVTVSLEDIGIVGIGSFAQLKSGDPSLFVFAELLTALGGPPAFFVTGVMAGFGFNRSLTIPGMDEVQGFPLLMLAQPPSDGSPAKPQDPTVVLKILEGEAVIAGETPRAWIAPQPGALWMAAGVQFKSFQIVTTNALLVVQPTGNVTIALLGISDMTLPLPGDSSTTYCFVEMQLRVVFQPNDGVFSASAVLSNSSYVLTPECHLSGGFAFSSWFEPSDHAGDFALTLGGYHPAFSAPDHYPVVPRLAFNWAVSDCVSITGDAYFALTPSCAMGGGGLQALFHDGDLQAWFTANADLLMSWRPFFFIGDIDVSIGVSYRMNLLFCHVTISLSIGASVRIWGPPTGGTVHVHLVVVTFTVNFGSNGAGTTTDPLKWSELAALLPHANSVCTVNPGGQLANTTDSSDSSSQKRWIVRPRGFSFSTHSAIPASHLASDSPAALHNTATDTGSIAIRPMYLKDLTSTHTVKISRNSADSPAIDVSAWSFTPRSQSVPATLWGSPPDKPTQIPAVPSNDLVKDQFVGYTIATPAPSLTGEVGAIVFKLLAEEYITPEGAAPLNTTLTLDSSYLPSPATTTIAALGLVNKDPARAGRTALFGALQAANVSAGVNGPLDKLASNSAHLFADAPMQEA